MGQDITTQKTRFFPYNIFLKLEKQLFSKKNCWSGPIKNKNSNIYNVQCCIFSKKYIYISQKNKNRDIIILHLCTKNLYDTIYSSWDVAHDKLNLVILVDFLPFYLPENPKTQNLKKMKKLTEDIIILHV